MGNVGFQAREVRSRHLILLELEFRATAMAFGPLATTSH